MSERPNPARPDPIDGGDGRDGIDTLLRDSMADAPPPVLTPTFTERVTERLRPRHLPARARRTLRLYTVAAAVLSVSVMASLGVEPIVIALALAVPAAIALLLRKRPL